MKEKKLIYILNVEMNFIVLIEYYKLVVFVSSEKL